jgi:hypothetical protein
VKACKVCSTYFIPARPLQSVCSPKCAMKHVRTQKKAEIATTRQRKAALKTIPDLIKEADRVFASYIRERDRQAGYLCISSGQLLDWSGNQVDAGHYRSRGAAPHLRYHPDNCHAQTKRDNRYLAGNAIDYRMGLISRIGLARVEALETDNTPKKWTRDELIAITNEYRAKLRELKKEN